MHVMVDLETLSTKSNAAIVAIGAVAFDRHGVADPLTTPTFYVTITPESNEQAGRHISGSTVLWWMRQSDEARKAITTGSALPLNLALDTFSTWFKNVDGNEVWGNGATFDNVILSSAYDDLKMKRPWSYRSDRCYRTLAATMNNDVYEKLWALHAKGTHHNALDDALRQANIAVDIHKELGI